MELGTHLKPHILSVQMTVKRSSGTFLGESPVCFQALGLVLERDQRLATMLGFSCRSMVLNMQQTHPGPRRLL